MLGAESEPGMEGDRLPENRVRLVEQCLLRELEGGVLDADDFEGVALALQVDGDLERLYATFGVTRERIYGDIACRHMDEVDTRLI